METINYEIMLKVFKQNYSDYYAPNWSAEDILKKDNVNKNINEPWTYLKIIKTLDLDTDILTDVSSLIDMLKLEYEFYGCETMKLVSKSFRTGCSEWEPEYYIIINEKETVVQAEKRTEVYQKLIKEKSLAEEQSKQDRKNVLEKELKKIQEELKR